MMKRVLLWTVTLSLSLVGGMAVGIWARTPHHPPAPVPAATPWWHWMIGMDPGCWVTGEPVAGECIEGDAPLCETHPDSACWDRDPAGRVWHWPHGRK